MYYIFLLVSFKMKCTKLCRLFLCIVCNLIEFVFNISLSCKTLFHVPTNISILYCWIFRIIALNYSELNYVPLLENWNEKWSLGILLRSCIHIFSIRRYFNFNSVHSKSMKLESSRSLHVEVQYYIICIWIQSIVSYGTLPRKKYANIDLHTIQYESEMKWQNTPSIYCSSGWDSFSTLLLTIMLNAWYKLTCRMCFSISFFESSNYAIKSKPKIGFNVGIRLSSRRGSDCFVSFVSSLFIVVLIKFLTFHTLCMSCLEQIVHIFHLHNVYVVFIIWTYVMYVLV